VNTEPESPQITSAGDEKARLECEKLKAEITAINKPLVKTPGFYSAIAPVALAILGLAFSWWSGWFDVQQTRVSNEKTLLEAQTERLKMEQTTLEAKAQEQQATFVKAEGEIQTLKERESFLTNQLVRLERESSELRSAKDLLENETKRLAGSDAKAMEFLGQLKSLQATREQEEALIRRANEVLSEGWGIALKDRATWAKFQDFGQHMLEFRVASTPYLPEWQVDPDPVLLPNEKTGRTYDDDRLRALRQMSKKTAEDIMNEAIEKRIMSGAISESEAGDLRKKLLPLVQVL
jgi:hypothetical protein